MAATLGGAVPIEVQIVLAARIHQYGPPAAIAVEEVEPPRPDAGEVVVRVGACGVGNWDSLVRSGRSGLALSLPVVLGAEVAGTVVEIGGGGKVPFANGEAVYGSTNPQFVGGYAQYAKCQADMLIRKSPQLSEVEAAALPVAGVTAWQMVVEHARVIGGQTVVVHGAAGNVGALAAQSSLALGARVIGTVHRAEDEEVVRALGVAEILKNPADYRRLAQKADAVIDTVGGSSQALLFELVTPGGILVSSVSRPDAALAERAHIRSDYFIVSVTAARLTAITKLLEGSRRSPRIGTTLPLAAARVAHEMLDGARPHPSGKIVLNVA